MLPCRPAIPRLYQKIMMRSQIEKIRGFRGLQTLEKAEAAPRPITFQNLIRRERKILVEEAREDIEADVRAKMASSIDDVFVIVIHDEEKLKTESIIRLMSPWCRFLIMNETIEINFSKSSKAFRRSRIKKFTIRRFVGLFKNCTKNRIYKRTDKFKILARTSCFLRINDKKNSIIEKKSFYSWFHWYLKNEYEKE